MTLNGQEAIETVEGNNFSLLDAKGNRVLILKSNIRAKNGVLHIMSKVLLPQ